jgi:hypothetical protein
VYEGRELEVGPCLPLNGYGLGVNVTVAVVVILNEALLVCVPVFVTVSLTDGDAVMVTVAVHD